MAETIVRKLSKADLVRITCQDAYNMELRRCGKQATLCHVLPAATGGPSATSFFYLCAEHSAASLERARQRKIQAALNAERYRRERIGELRRELAELEADNAPQR